MHEARYKRILVIGSSAAAAGECDSVCVPIAVNPCTQRRILPARFIIYGFSEIDATSYRRCICAHALVASMYLSGQNGID